MTTENANPNEHSLSATIDLDFAKSVTSAEAFQLKINEIKKAFENISTSAKSINGGVGARLKQLLDAVEKTQAIDVNVGAVKDKIENAIVTAMTKATINLKGLHELSVSLTPEDFSHIETELTKQARAAFKKVTVEPFVFGNLTLSAAAIKSVKSRFETELRKSIQDTMSFDFKDAEGKLSKFKLEINAGHMQGMLDAVRNKFVEQLSDPKMVVIDGLDQPLRIKNEDFQRAYQNLATSVQNNLSEALSADKVLGLDGNMEKFQAKIRVLAEQINTLDIAFKGIKLNAEDTDIRDFVVGLRNLKGDMISSLQVFLSSVRAQVESVNSPFLPDLVMQLQHINTVISKAISGRFDAAIQTVLSRMGLMTAEIDGKNVIVPAIKKLEQSLEQAAKQMIAPEDLKKTLNMIDSVMNTRIQIILNEIKATTSSKVTASLMKELNDAISLKVTQAIAEIRNLDSQAVDLPAMIGDINNVLVDRLVKAAEGLKVAAGEAGPEFNMTGAIRLIDNGVHDILTHRLAAVTDALKGVTVNDAGGYRAHINKFDPEVRKILAERMDKTVAELKKENKGYLTGPDAMNMSASANVESIFRKFHEIIGNKATDIVIQYKTALDAVAIEPDLSSIPYLIKKFENIQVDIVDKVRELMDIQFNALAAAIRNLQANPLSLGYTPPTSVAKAATASSKAVAAMVGAAAGSAASTRSVGAASSPRTSYTGTSGGGRMYYPINDLGTNPSEQKYTNPGGDTHSFMGSVKNTLRYMTAGMIMGGPSILMYDAWNAAKQSDTQFTKAQVNLTAKGMDDAARQKLGPTATPDQISAESLNMKAYVNQGPLKRQIQNIGIAYGLLQPDAFSAYQEATRKYNDPKEALALTRGLARMKSIEGDISVQDAASGLTSMGAQWHLNGYQLEKASDMIIAAANTKFTKAADILETQKRSGNLFMQNMVGTKGADGQTMDKMGALASSIGLSAIYTEATGRAGAQSGTFWKNIITSPFSKQTSKYLQDISQSTDPRLQALNPYTPHKNDKGQTVNDTKGGLEMLLNITDAMKVIDPKTKNGLQEMVAKQWFKGDMSAVQSLLTDMDNINGSKDIQAHGGIASYFKQLKDSPTAMTDKMSAQMANTWEFQQARLQSTFQAASSDVFDKLKPNFASVADYIGSLLLAVRENSTLVANGISLLTKALLAVGGKFVVDKIGDMYKNAKENKRQTGLAQDINRNRYYLNEEGRAANLKRMIVGDNRADLQDKLDRVNAKRGLIDINGSNAELDYVNTQIQKLEGQKIDLEDKNLGGTVAHTKVNDTLTDLDSRKRQLERKLTVGGTFDPKLEAEAKALEVEMREVDRLFKQVDKSAMSVNSRMDAMDMHMKDVAFDTKRLTTEMLRVDRSMTGASASSMGLRERYSMLGREAGLSDGKIGKLITDVDKLEHDFAQTRNLDEFIRKLRELERLNRLQNMPLLTKMGPNGTYVPGVQDHGGSSVGTAADVTGNKAAFGADLATTVLAGTAISQIGKNEPGKPGLLKRVWNGAKGLFGMSTATDVAAGEAAASEAAAAAEAAGAAGTATKVASTVSKTSRLAKIGGLLKKPLSLLTDNPWMAAFMVGSKLLTDVVGPSMMAGPDRQKIEASKLDEVANNAVWGEHQNPVVRIGNYAAEAWNAAWNNGMHLLGGTSPELAQSRKIGALAAKYRDLPPDVAKQKIDDAMGISKMASDAGDAQKKKLLADQVKEAAKYIKVTGDPATDIQLGKKNWSDVTSFDEGQLMAQQLNKDLQISQQNLTAQNEYDKASLMIRGVRDDSQQMRDLMKEFFSKNIKALDAALNGVKDSKGNVITEGIVQKLQYNIGPDARQNLELQAAQIKAQIAQEQQNIYQNDTSAVDSRLTLLNTDKSRIQAKGDISKANALLGGALDNSPTIHNIDATTGKALNTRIEQTKSELATLLDKYKNNDDMRLKIEDQMLQLSLEQKNNLVAIRKAMQNDKSTFNLPAGVQPMTYWEMKVKDGTHKNISVGNGDTNVNITIDKMSGDQAALDRLGKTVADAIRKERGINVSNELANQVRTGIQNNFRG
jgi:hypothetical protein